MFSVNIDKLTNMTESERNSYQKICDDFLKQFGEECHKLAIIGGGVKAFKIASIIMENNKKVLFIDGDMTSDVFLGKYKLGKNLKGITDYMKRNNPEDQNADELVCITNKDNMNIVFTGMLEDNEISEEEEKNMIKLLSEYEQKFDYIIVDSDRNGKIAKYCDGTFVVIDEGDYSELSADNYINELDDNGCKVLGVIINE